MKKKAAVGLLVVIASAILGWVVREKFDSEKAGYIVAVAAMTAAIVPIFLSGSDRGTRITTSGDNSPGVVGGDYSVNPKDTPKEKSEVQASGLPLERESALSIGTSGNFSPGFVARDYVVNHNEKIEITQATVKQEAATKRKTWRELDATLFPSINETPAANAVIFETFLMTMVEMFERMPYTEFILLVNQREITTGEKKLPAYTVLCYQPGFCSNAHRKYRKFVDLYLAWKDASKNPENRAAIERERLQQGAILEGWTRNIEFPDSFHWLPIRCVCDSIGRTLTLTASTDFSVNLASYPDHLATTKELMLFIGSRANISGAAVMGDIGWIGGNYSLQKLVVAMMDGKLDLKNIRVNADDSNEWDYVNGEFDEEVRLFEKRGSGTTPPNA